MAERYVLGADNLRRAFRSLRERDIPGVMMRSIDAVRLEAKDAAAARIGSVFSDPTPYTMRAVYSTKPTRNDLAAFVGIKDSLTRPSGRQAGYLAIHETGGIRPHTRFEAKLMYAGVIRRGEYVVPAGTKITRGIYAQVLSQLNALDPKDNKSGSARSKRSRQRRGSIFVTGGREVRLGGVDLPRGIWRRQGIVIEPLFWITRKPPRYQPRLGFERTVTETVRTRFIEIARDQAAKTILRNRDRGWQ